MKCCFCGAEINEDKKFCKECGRPVIHIDENETDNNGYMMDITSSAAAFSNHSIKQTNSQENSDSDISYGGIASVYDKRIKNSNADVYAAEEYNQTDNCPVYTGYFGAVKLFFTNFINFYGRSTIDEYNKATDLIFVYNFIFLFIFPIALGYSISEKLEVIFRNFIIVTDVLLTVPFFSLTIRRFHDMGRSAIIPIIWFAVIILDVILLIANWSQNFLLNMFYMTIIFAPALALIVVCSLFKGQDEKNKWGPMANPMRKIR